MTATIVASAIPNEWAYVAGAYGVTIGSLGLLAVWTIIRGRRVGRQLPPDERRWM